MESLNLDCDGTTTNTKVENVAEHLSIEMEIQKEKEIISFGSLEVVEGKPCIIDEAVTGYSSRESNHWPVVLEEFPTYSTTHQVVTVKQVDESADSVVASDSGALRDDSETRSAKTFQESLDLNVQVGPTSSGTSDEAQVTGVIADVRDKPQLPIQQLVASSDATSEIAALLGDLLLSDSKEVVAVLAMPACAEKSLVALHLHFKTELDFTQKVASKDKDVALLVSDDIRLIFVALQQQLVAEELDDYEVVEQMRAIEDLLSGDSVAGDKITNGLWRLLKCIQPLDVTLLMDLLGDTETAAQRIKGKDIVLLLGGTGAGKSTTVHFLAGSKMKKTMEGGLKHIAPEVTPTGELSKFITSPLPRSETRTIRDITIQHIREGATEVQPVTLCDTPGFGDTDGVEIDIANGMGVVKAVQLCRSVKPLVLMSKLSMGDRMEGVVKLSRILLKFMPRITEHLHTFSYAFTKYSVDEEDEIAPLLEVMVCNPPSSQSSDEGFMCLLGDMATKTAQQTHVVHLLTDGPQDLLDSLLSTTFIEEPSGVFCYFVAQESFDRLREQLTKHQMSVHRAARRLDVPLLIAKMDELLLLRTGLIFPECVGAYEDCVREVARCIDDLMGVMNSWLDAAMRDLNASVEQDIALSIDSMSKLSLLEPLRARHCAERPDLVELVHMKLVNTQQALLHRVTTYSLSSDSHRALECTASRLSKMKIVSNIATSSLGGGDIFSEMLTDLARMYQDGCSHMSVVAAQSKSTAAMCIQDNAWPALLSEMDRLKLMTAALDGHLFADQLENVYWAVQQQVVDYWVAAVTSINSLLKEAHISQDDVNQIGSVLGVLQSAARHEGFDQHVQEGQAEQCLRSVIHGASSYVLNICIDLCAEESQTVAFPEVLEKLLLVDSMRTLSEVAHPTDGAYQTTVRGIRSRICDLRERLLSALATLRADPSTDAFDAVLFTSRLQQLESAKCFEGHVSEVFAADLKDVVGALVCFHEELLQAFVSNPLQVTQRDGLSLRHEWLQAVHRLGAASNCSLLVESMTALFASNVSDILSQSLSVFDAPTVSWKDVEDVLLFLMQCQTVGVTNVDGALSALVGRVELFAMEHFSALEKLWDENFQCFATSVVHPADEMAACAAKLRSVCARLREINCCFKPGKTKAFRVAFNYYADIFDTLPRKLGTACIEMALPSVAARLKEAQDIKHLKTREELLGLVQICGALKGLDQFAPNKRPKFSELLAQFEAAIATIKKTALQGIQIALASRKYHDVVRAVADFEVSTAADQDAMRGVIKELTGSLRVVAEQLEDELAQDGKFATVEMFCAFLVKLKRAKADMLIVLHLFDATPRINMPKRFAKIELDIVHWMNGQLDQVQQRIKRSDFHACEVTLKLVEDIHGCLAEALCESQGDIRTRIDRAKSSINHTRVALRKQVSGEANYFASMPLLSYSRRPPVEFFAELEKCREDDPLYAVTATVLAEKINQAVRSSLEKLRTADPAECEAQVQLVECSARFLPPRVAGMCEDFLRGFKSDLQSAHEAFDRQMQEDKAKGDFKLLVQRCVEHFDNSYFCVSNKYVAEIRMIITEGFARFQNDLSSGNLLTVLQNFPEVFSDWRHYIKKISPVSKCLITTKWGTDKEADKLCHDMINSVRQELVRRSQEAETASDSWKISPRKMEVLLYFFEFKHREMAKANHHPSEVFYHCLVDNHKCVEEGVGRAVLKIVGWFAANTQRFEESLCSASNASIRQTMERALLADELFRKLQDASTDIAICQGITEFVAAFRACKGYDEMRSTLARHILTWVETVNQPFVNNEQTKTGSVLDRDAFYSALYGSYRSVKELKLLAAHVDERLVDVNAVEQLFQMRIQRNLEDLEFHVMNILQSIPTDDEKIVSGFNIWCDNFRSFVDNFHDPSLKAMASGLKDHTRDALKRKVDCILSGVSDQRDLEEVMPALVSAKRVAMAVPSAKTDIDKLINQYMSGMKGLSGGMRRIGLLGVLLNKPGNGEVAQRLINDHPAFEGYALKLRNEKTQKFTVESVLEKLRGNQAIDKCELHAQYERFDCEYEALVLEGITNDLRVVKDNIVSSARITAVAGLDKMSRSDKVRSLIAHTLAWWTLSHAKHYVEALEANKEADGEGEVENENSYLMQPHAAQVISIFRLLAVDASQLSNHLVQIATGEGKSVVLAITSTVLALLGYEVYCGCYSQYLSARDCESFQDMFHAFRVNLPVHYGTFNKLCENFINERGDVRNIVETAMSGNAMADACCRASSREKVLLIDEVNVFFNKEFYGNLYKPVAKLADPTVTALFNYVWNQRSSPTALKFKVVQRSEEYAAVLRHYRGWEELIGEAVKTLLLDLKTFESQDYVVLNGRVGYKEQDAISFDVSYGYKTLFAHYKEWTARSVTRATLESKIALYVDCGNFSYAEVPKGYLHVMGVSGTLEALSAPKKHLLEETYQIRKHTFVPSVYGASNLDFQGDSINGVRIESSAGYHNAICNEITTRLHDTNGRESRAVLVFFSSRTKLMDFYNSLAFQSRRHSARVVTEEVSALGREDIVRQAVTSGSVTLLTSEFGRGTDFICYDDRLLDAGGVHVLQTYVSDEVSEEIQIQGRTARQGNRGSFSMVLLDEELEKYGIVASTIATMNSSGKLYSTIDEKRNRFYELQYPKDNEYVEDIQRDHALSTRFLTSLVAGDISAVKRFLVDQNRAPRDDIEVTRTICLMDATGSMSSLLSGAKQKVKTMFANAHTILEQEGYEAAFELQFAVYRNYSSPPDQLMQYSGWASKPAELVNFMDGIRPAGGLGNEAIEVGFWHVNNEIAAGSKVSQVILIGDMPANSPEEVVTKRGLKKEDYWRNTKFATPVHVATELAKIQEKGVPVHTFYVKPHARSMFEDTARTTGGTSCALDLNSSDDMLTHLVTTNILNKVGGVREGVDHGAILVNAYRAKFTRGYVAGNGEEA